MARRKMSARDAYDHSDFMIDAPLPSDFSGKPDHLTPGQRVRLIHWLDQRLQRGPCGTVERLFSGSEVGLYAFPAAEVRLDIGWLVPAWVYELEVIR